MSLALHHPRSIPKIFVGGDPVERLAATLRHTLSHEESLRASIVFDERVVRNTFQCVSARSEAQRDGPQRPVPLPLKHVHKSGEFTVAVHLPRYVVSSPMLGTDDTEPVVDAAGECVESVIDLAMSTSLHMAAVEGSMALGGLRRHLAAGRRLRKGTPSPYAPSATTAGDSPRSTSDADASSRLQARYDAAYGDALTGPSAAASPALEAHLQLKCLRVERSALLFKYRTLWIEALEAQHTFLEKEVRPQFKVQRRPIAVLILSRTARMHAARKAYRRIRASVLVLQRVGRGRLGRQFTAKHAAALTLSAIVQRVGRCFASRLSLARSFKAELTAYRRNHAATVIQAKFRMCAARDRYLQLKVQAKSAWKIQRIARKWLQKHLRRQRLLASERAEILLQSRMLMTDARSCETAERTLIVGEEADARETILSCVCRLAAAFSRLAFVDQLIANCLRSVPTVLSTSAIALSPIDLTTPLLASMFRDRRAAPAERTAASTGARRRVQLQLVRQEQLEAVDRYLNGVMLEQLERGVLRQQHLTLLHRLVRL